MRKTINWLDCYMEYTKKAESPSAYHQWCGISVVAACLRRQVWLNMGHFDVYPNMYIVLVGPPGCRKNSAINIATRLASKLDDVKFSADATTREALIRAIAGCEAKLELSEKKEPYIHSSLTIISKELSVFLGTHNYDLLSLLTDMYDCVCESTEILTKNGWKTINTIHQDDEVLTMNLQTELLEYKPINFIVKKDVDKTVHLESRAISQVVSLGHNILFKIKADGKLRLKRADELIQEKTKVYIPLGGIPSPQNFNIPSEVVTQQGQYSNLWKMSIVGGHTKVWCVNTDNNTMVIRRNGKVSITGNCHDKWEYRTKNMGIDTLRGVWLNMLAGTTPAWLVGSVPMNAIGGGFTSRVIFVVEHHPRHRNARPLLSEHEKQLQVDLWHDLEQISMMKGEMTLEKEGEEWYVDWYESNPPRVTADIRFDGYYERKHIHLLKTAMVISASFSNDKIIRLNHLKSALYILDQLEEKMVDAFGGAGRSIHAPDIDAVLKYIQEYKVISREQLLKSVWRDVSPKDIDIVIHTLIEMKLIERTQDKGVLYYKLVEKQG